MAKKIMIVCGSPRKNGNTVTVAKWVAEGARKAGAEVEMVDAAHLSYKANGCTACMGCQKSETFQCVIDDEASPILGRIPEQNVLVLASPVYFMGFTAQLKLFLDRMFCMFKFTGEEGQYDHALGNTEMALIATAGADKEGGLGLIEQTADMIAGFVGKKARKLLVPLAPMEAGKMAEDAAWREKAMAFGTDLAG